MSADWQWVNAQRQWVNFVRASCEFGRVTGSPDRGRGYVGRREEGDGVAEREFSDRKVGREDEPTERGNLQNEVTREMMMQWGNEIQAELNSGQQGNCGMWNGDKNHSSECGIC